MSVCQQSVQVAHTERGVQENVMSTAVDQAITVIISLEPARVAVILGTEMRNVTRVSLLIVLRWGKVTDGGC